MDMFLMRQVRHRRQCRRLLMLGATGEIAIVTSWLKLEIQGGLEPGTTPLV
jgi:hypothetical protein